MDAKEAKQYFRQALDEEEERYLRETLAILQDSYAQSAKPYIDRLAAIHAKQSPSKRWLERTAFDIADAVIEEAYPNIYNLEKGMWGHQRIQNYGILRGAIASAIQKERERSNA